MKRLLAVFFSILTLTAACSKKEEVPQQPAAPPAAPQTLNLFIWSEYIDPGVVADFEKQTGVKVKISLFESNDEMVSKLQLSAGAMPYDLVVPTNSFVPQMIRLDLLQPLDHTKIPNIANLMDKFKNPTYDPGNKYTAGYLWGTVGLLYRKDKFADLAPSWSVIFDATKQRGSFVLLDDMRDMMAVALRYQGSSVSTSNPDELKKVGDVLLGAKSSAKFLGFDGGVGGKNKVLSDGADMAVVYNGDGMRAVHDDPRVEFVIPQEGASLGVDSLAIPKGAPNVEAAHQFINFILEPQMGARNASFMKYATPNQAALPFIDEKDRNDPRIYPTGDLLQRLEFIADPGEAARLYDEVWTAVKSR